MAQKSRWKVILHASVRNMGVEWFHPQMRKFILWLSTLPVKGTEFALHVF